MEALRPISKQSLLSIILALRSHILSFTLPHMFPRMKCLMLLLLALFTDLQRCNADPNAQWAKELVNIRAFDNYPPHKLHWWNNQVVATLSSGGSSDFFTFRWDALEPVRLSIPGLHSIIDIGSEGRIPWALGETQGKLALVRKLKGEWSDIVIPATLAKAEKAFFIPSVKGVAILSANFIFEYYDGAWTTRAMPKLPRIKEQFTPDKVSKQLLFGNQLFVGWNLGEFGGMLAEVNFEHLEPKWDILKASKETPSSGLRGGPITGVAVDGGGILWASIGSSHMGSMYRGLFRYDGKSWKTVVYGIRDEAKGGVISFPGEETDIVDLFTDEDGKLNVLGGKLGIFTYENKQLIPQISFDFYALDKTVEHQNDATISSTRTCYPDNFVIDDHHNAFVATSYYEILCFLKNGDQYSLRQIILPTPKH